MESLALKPQCIFAFNDVASETRGKERGKERGLLKRWRWLPLGSNNNKLSLKTGSDPLRQGYCSQSRWIRPICKTIKKKDAPIFSFCEKLKAETLSSALLIVYAHSELHCVPIHFLPEKNDIELTQRTGSKDINNG